ncbi:MAG: hypothetical protein A2X49_08640 [Lentisphaerae bacterium GWF2_52_8]|nr:MAG: hypothetical protein A2X49_08640 [Lentisphaerae bacterium GWF2_52_8]
MPLVKAEISVPCGKEKKLALAKALSKLVSKGTGKPESYVASVVEDDAAITFAGEEKPGAFVEVRGIGGLSASTNKKLSADICACLEEELGIPSTCVYINFTEIPATNWGWKGSTFG